MTTNDATPPGLARFEQYRLTGNIDLRNELVEEHINLARGFARRYSRRGVALEDLEQVAQMSLIGAVERFDPALGIRFQTFAGRTVDGELKRHFRDKAWAVKVPRRFQDLGVAIRATLDTLTKELERTPTIAELAEAVGAEMDEVVAAMEASQAFTADSIDAPGSSGDEAPTIADELGTSDIGPGVFDDQEQITGLLSSLPDREREIVELRFFGERSQRDIAEEVGISQMHVSRLLRRALARLRSSLAEQDDGVAQP